MSVQEIKNKLEDLKQKIAPTLQSVKLPQIKQQLAEMQDKMQESGFWDDSQFASDFARRTALVQKQVESWERLTTDLEEALALCQGVDLSLEDESFLEQEAVRLHKLYEDCRLNALFSGKHDSSEAVFAIHAGAGGTDAQDWAEMLLRMYLRFCEKKGFKVETLEMSKGAEAGIKSVLLDVRGEYAYGLLKAEAGVHRLVRLSPFNPAHTRETSFALVEVLPKLEEAESVTLNPTDLKIEATTASGHGGQSVNTTYSAIRITHIPTGLKVSIQNERSQYQNKELAMKILASRLQLLEDERLEQEKKDLRGEFKSAEWGNQIRSYVLHPYKLVKDHRTGLESTDPETVLSGDLDEFIEKFLEFEQTKKNDKAQKV